MNIDHFRLPSSTWRTTSRWLSVMLVTLLSIPSVGFAGPRGGASLRKAGAGAASLASVIVVNTTGDGDNVNPSAGCDTDAAAPGEQCSLRAAIERANALDGEDEIRFNIPSTEPNCTASSGHCLIYLTKALPALATNVRIEGPGADKLHVRRSTGGDYRIFTVTSATQVTISGMVISGGKPFGRSAGGALANAGSGTVNIVNSYLNGNTAGADGGDGGALYNAGDGTINVIGSSITDNTAPVPVVDGASGGGGGIYNASTGTINVINSFIGGNKVQGGRIESVSVGGGIYNASTGTVSITGSVITQNTVTLAVAANSSGGGAGISNGPGTVNITDSIINENFITGGDSGTSVARGAGILNGTTGTVNVTAGLLFNNIVSGSGGGIANISGTLNVTNSTITANRGNGGGLFGQATVKSSIIARNNLGPFAGSDVAGSFTSAGFNLVGVEDGSTGFNASTDQKGTAAAPLDPKFDPNPVVLTILGTPLQLPGLPLCGSPAIDQGTSAGLNGSLTTDLRGAGFPRTVDDPAEPNADDGTDVGAFERQSICVQAAFTVNTTGDADDVSPGDGVCDSDAAAAGAQCTLRAAMREANALSGDVAINFAIPTNDPGYDPSMGRHTINLTAPLPDITNVNLALNGPGADRLTVRRHTGGFYRVFTFGSSFGSIVETVSISGLSVSNGFSSADGGGLSFTGQTLNVNGCVFSDNTTGGSGGGVFAFAGTKITVRDSTFSGNFSGATTNLAGGGGIYARGSLSVTNSTFSDNLANSAGGGINSDNNGATADSDITNSTFEGNGADAGGGLSVGIFGAVMRVNNSTFRRNTSTLLNSQGGGIYHLYGTLHINGSTFTGNEGFGVASNAANNAHTNITASTISGNTWGGIHTEAATVATAKLNIINSTISGNTGGPGLKLSRVTLNVTNSTISSNEEGGIRTIGSGEMGTWTVKSSIIAANGGLVGDVQGAFASGGFNLIGKAEFGTGFTQPTDQTGTTGAPLDPKLDPAGLQNYGGPTPTIALLPDSPAIDKGTADGLAGALATDQRGSGFARSYDDAAVTNAADGTDIGAFESQPGGPTPTPTPTPTPSPTPMPSPSPTPMPSPTPTPTPPPSPTPTPTPAPANLVFTLAPLARSSCGDIVVSVLVQNIGGVTANNVVLTGASLAPSGTNGTPLPQSLGNIAPGQWAVAIVIFSGANNPAGAKRTLRLDGTLSGGAFTERWKVILP